MVNSDRVTLRDYNSRDTEDLIQLFRTTVRRVGFGDYNQEQLAAWAPDVIDPTPWRARQSTNVTVIGLIEDQIVGFGELSDEGCIHMLYVSASHQNRGVASLLLAALENRARSAGMSCLRTYASLTAKGFFARCGYQVSGPNTVTVGNQVLDNFLMEKPLTAVSKGAD